MQPDSKKIIILSDNVRLAIAIELNLCGRLGFETIVLAPDPDHCSQVNEEEEIDLVVVALSLPSSEPVVILSRAGLAEHIGTVPLLIISERPFEPDQESQIHHLDFPFEAKVLRTRVTEILGIPADLRQALIH
jgi:hypothetical protein